MVTLFVESTRSDGQNQRIHKIGWSESKNPQDRMVRIVSANHITWTVISPLYHGHILRRIYKIGWSELYRPIRSLGQLLNRYIMVTFFGESSSLDGHNCIGQSDHLDGYSTVINSHSHRRHPQVQMVRPWSLSRLRAKVGLSCPQLSRLERISSLRAKAGLSRPQ